MHPCKKRIVISLSTNRGFCSPRGFPVGLPCVGTSISSVWPLDPQGSNCSCPAIGDWDEGSVLVGEVDTMTGVTTAWQSDSFCLGSHLYWLSKWWKGWGVLNPLPFLGISLLNQMGICHSEDIPGPTQLNTISLTKKVSFYSPLWNIYIYIYILHST